MTADSEFERLRTKLIDQGLTGGDSLPVLARSAEDPGQQYFAELKLDLKRLFDLLGDSRTIDRELAAALFGIGHHAYVNYEASINHGREFRDTLIDPDLIDLEMAVDSIFTCEWVTL
ncbi:hypothetical protein CA13_10410 [Planctomycetes bacterium CA13]|uniref:Uncharacterized protein n=1 Tax=Novipirellula herctigrandis TaxID=2527986 RepID=A0A5C5YYI6_9BACT|nr:hypothetical protein CA13_10410 [Planctomycetes bacterium CA13]